MDRLTPELEWLTGPDAEAILFDAATHKLDPTKLALALSKKLAPERARLVAEQYALRHKAVAKFPDFSDRLFLTPLGLQQATDQWVANYKARRFQLKDKPDCHVADLCCGIGGDAMALGRDNTVTLIDNDPKTLHFAFENLKNTTPQSKHRALLDNVETIDTAQFTAWHIDPDRRPSGNRTTQPELHSPSLKAIRKLLDRNPNGAIKLAPAAIVRGEWPETSELQWISRDRQCRQLVVWHGELAHKPDARTATAIRTNSNSSEDYQQETFCGDNYATCESCDEIGRYLIEPDSAVLAADLWGDLAVQYDLKTPTPSIPYLTADTIPDNLPRLLIDIFETMAVMPLDRKKLRAELRRLDIGRLEIKKRGSDINPEQLRKQLKLKGDDNAVLIIMPHAGKVTAILARRIGH